MMCVLCVQRVSRQLRVLKHMHMKGEIALRSPIPGGLSPLDLIHYDRPFLDVKIDPRIDWGRLFELKAKPW